MTINESSKVDYAYESPRERCEALSLAHDDHPVVVGAEHVWLNYHGERRPCGVGAKLNWIHSLFKNFFQPRSQWYTAKGK